MPKVLEDSASLSSNVQYIMRYSKLPTEISTNPKLPCEITRLAYLDALGYPQMSQLKAT